MPILWFELWRKLTVRRAVKHRRNHDNANVLLKAILQPSADSSKGA